MQDVTAHRVHHGFKILLRKQDALRDELRGNMLPKVASTCKKHFDRTLQARPALAAKQDALQGHSQPKLSEDISKYDNLCTSSCALTVMSSFAKQY